MDDTTTASADLARYAIRPLLPGPLESLRDAVLRLGAGPHVLPALAEHGAAEALAVQGLRADQTRVLEREMKNGGGAVVTSPDGDRAVVLGSVAILSRLADALVEWGQATAPLGVALREALIGNGGRPAPLRAGSHRLEFGRRTHVMGVVNVTPDSFSGDGVGSDVGRAVAQAEEMVAAGASLIDVGGESTRPNSSPVDVATEQARVLPVVQALASTLSVPVSIDSRKAAVARTAVEAGATIINDVWGLQGDPRMVDVLSDHPHTACVAMHNATDVEYEDLMVAVAGFLRHSVLVAERGGVHPARLVIDPGFGFAKTPAHNLELIRRLGELRGLGRPLLVGPSRKHTIGVVLDGAPAAERVEGTLALAVLAAQAGADIIRVHDVAACVRALRVADAVTKEVPDAVLEAPIPGPTG